MIIDFSIQNYAAIKDKVTLTFEPENSNRLADFYLIEPIPGYKLLKLGIIYGPNGSGKTTLLRALDFLKRLILAPATQKQELLEFEPYLFDTVSRNEATVFTLNFISGGHRYLYEIAFTKSAVLKEVLYAHNPKKALVFERNTDTKKQLSSIRFGSKIKVKKAEEDTLVTNTLWNATVLATFLRANIDSAELREATDWFLTVLADFVTPDTDLYHSVSGDLMNNHIDKQRMLVFMKKADLGITNIVVEKKMVPLRQSRNVLVTTTDIAHLLPNNAQVEHVDVQFEHAVTGGKKKAIFSLPY